MPTTFPISLDSLPSSATLAAKNLAGGPAGTTTVVPGDQHSDWHADLGDAIEAIEVKVGVDGSAEPTSIDYRLAAVEAVTAEVDEKLVSLVWDTPGAESGNAIEIAASMLTLSSNSFASNLVDVSIVVTDSAADCEPSATATLSAANTPVGTVLGGTGTASLVIRTSSSGTLKIKVTETAAGFRYLWVRQAGHARMWVRARDGVQELSFA